MERKTYVVYYTPTITDPDPEPDVVTGVLVEDGGTPEGVVKFDVGLPHLMILVGVENVVLQ